MNGRWYRRPRIWIALAIFLLGLFVYKATSSPTLDFWDAGEFITTSHILGIPHQPGTPLYVLVGRVFDILFGSPAIDQPALRTAPAVNFMSIFFSALALALVYLIILDVSRRNNPDAGWLAQVGGAVGALFLMFGQTYWNNAIEAEVYGLAAFMIALLTWLALRWYDARGSVRSDRLLYLMAYLLGLGVGFHMGTLLSWFGIVALILLARDRQLPLTDLLGLTACVVIFILSTMELPGSLMAVFLLAFVGLALVRGISGRPFLLVVGALFLLGLSVHLLLLIRAGLNPAINESQPDSLSALLGVLRREQYPPINPFVRRAPLGWQFKYYYDFLFEQFRFLSGHGWLPWAATLLGPIFLGVLGIYQTLRRARRIGVMLLASYLINGEILTIYLNFTQNEVRERDYFYFAAFLFFAVFIGLGAAALLRWAAGPEGEPAAAAPAGGGGAGRPAAVRPGGLTWVAAGVLLAIALWPALEAIPGPTHGKWFEHDRSHNRIAREYAWNLLAGLPPGAIVFTNGDNDTFPLWYMQEVERFRRDVSVVNLSLINLPWYAKQLRGREPAVPLGFSDRELDRLRPTLYEDPNSGQRYLVYVRDYVVADIVAANARDERPRPVFFAVTVPQENMARYYPFLQMEGLVFRLVGTRSETGQPTVDPERLLDNMIGIYDYDAVLSGDSDERRRLYAEARGWDLRQAGELWSEGRAGDLPAGMLAAPDSLPPVPAAVLGALGEKRTDVYRDQNTRNLLGNYPAALVRAGGEYLARAQRTAPDDSTAYDRLTDRSLTTLEIARRFDPGFDLIVDVYPLLLIEKGRPEEALAYLEGLAGHVPPEREERAVREVVFALPRVGRGELARSWLQRTIAARPDRRFFYQLEFNLERMLGSLKGMEQTLQSWREHFGQEDPAMVQALQDAREQARQRERQQIEDAVGNTP